MPVFGLRLALFSVCLSLSVCCARLGVRVFFWLSFVSVRACPCPGCVFPVFFFCFFLCAPGGYLGVHLSLCLYAFTGIVCPSALPKRRGPGRFRLEAVFPFPLLLWRVGHTVFPAPPFLWLVGRIWYPTVSAAPISFFFLSGKLPRRGAGVPPLCKVDTTATYRTPSCFYVCSVYFAFFGFCYFFSFFFFLERDSTARIQVQ